MSANPIYFGTIKNWQAFVQNSDSTNFVSFIAAAGSGSKVESISVCNSDSGVATVLQLAVTFGANDYIIGEVTIPAGAGTNGSTKAVDLLNTSDLPWIRSDGANNYLYLASGGTLKVKAKVAVAGVNKIHLFAQGGDA